MSFSLDRVVPWGRTFDEYRRMFALTDDDLDGRILGCADGPASFNVELSARGGRIVSADPLYAAEPHAIRRRVDDCFDDIIDQVETHRDQFVWHAIESVEALARLRRTAMERFLADYLPGDPRYVDASLPTLPFADDAFDLALCSHFLFLYAEQFDPAFHVASIVELRRVAREVRVFPLRDLAARRPPHLDAIVARLEGEGLRVTIERVDYEFQRGGNEMLRVASDSGRPTPDVDAPA